jgi:hypothetical protein
MDLSTNRTEAAKQVRHVLSVPVSGFFGLMTTEQGHAAGAPGRCDPATDPRRRCDP